MRGAEADPCTFVYFSASPPALAWGGSAVAPSLGRAERSGRTGREGGGGFSGGQAPGKGQDSVQVEP